MAVQTTQLVAPSLRSGQFTSGNFSVPVGVLNLKLSANIALADKLSVGLACDLDVQHSADGGTTWDSAVGFGWTSYGPGGYPAGKTTPANPDPSVSFAPTAFLGQLFRVVVNIPQPLTIGASVDITT